MSEGRAMAPAECWVHKGMFLCDPDFVVTAVLPAMYGGHKVAVCDPCTIRVNKLRERHNREHPKNKVPLIELAAERARRLMA
jgi:hypothetical protein